jgi:hypothetical protein
MAGGGFSGLTSLPRDCIAWFAYKTGTKSKTTKKQHTTKTRNTVKKKGGCVTAAARNKQLTRPPGGNVKPIK